MFKPFIFLCNIICSNKIIKGIFSLQKKNCHYPHNEVHVLGMIKFENYIPRIEVILFTGTEAKSVSWLTIHGGVSWETGLVG